MAPPNPPPTSLPTQPRRQCSECHEFQPQDQFVPLQRLRAALGELTAKCLQCRSRHRSKRPRPVSNDLHLPPPPPQPPQPRFHRPGSYTVSQMERRQNDAASLRTQRARQRAGLPEPREVNTAQSSEPRPPGPASEEQGMAPGHEDGGQPSGDNNGLETSAGAAEKTRLGPEQDEPTMNADSASPPPQSSCTPQKGGTAPSVAES